MNDEDEKNSQHIRINEERRESSLLVSTIVFVLVVLDEIPTLDEVLSKIDDGRSDDGHRSVVPAGKNERRRGKAVSSPRTTPAGRQTRTRSGHEEFYIPRHPRNLRLVDSAEGEEVNATWSASFSASLLLVFAHFETKWSTFWKSRTLALLKSCPGKRV